MNNNIEFNKVISSLSDLGFKKIQKVKKIKYGINSEVYKFKVGRLNLVTKLYKHRGNLRIRREKQFYEYLKFMGESYE